MWDRTHIFGPYYIAGRECHADPMEVNELLSGNLGGDVNKVLAECHSDVKEVRLSALQKLVPAIRIAFMLPSFDRDTGEGCTWDYCIKLLNTFVRWEETLKKNGESSRTLSSAAVA